MLLSWFLRVRAGPALGPEFFLKVFVSEELCTVGWGASAGCGGGAELTWSQQWVRTSQCPDVYCCLLNADVGGRRGSEEGDGHLLWGRGKCAVQS